VLVDKKHLAQCLVPIGLAIGDPDSSLVVGFCNGRAYPTRGPKILNHPQVMEKRVLPREREPSWPNTRDPKHLMQLPEPVQCMVKGFQSGGVNILPSRNIKRIQEGTQTHDDLVWYISGNTREVYFH
jgi:hypothetical protein